MPQKYGNPIQEYKSGRQWKATTAVSEKQFNSLVPVFASAYITVYGRTMEERQADSLTQAKLKSPDELLFFLLFSIKTWLSYDALGSVFDIDGGGAKRYQASAIPVLKTALESLNVMPKRRIDSVEEFEEYFKEHRKLVLDGTEQRMQRPDNQEEQKICYSGKKKCHTVKTLVISSVMKVILFISWPYEGTAHDYPIVQMEFPPHQDWFAKFEVLADLGFQGFRKKYKALKVRIPDRKPRNGELSEAQKKEKRELSQERIVVEQSLAGLKRYRILADRLRMHDMESYSEILGICAGFGILTYSMQVIDFQWNNNSNDL